MFRNKYPNANLTSLELLKLPDTKNPGKKINKSTCRVQEKRLSLPWSQPAVPKSHHTHPLRAWYSDNSVCLAIARVLSPALRRRRRADSRSLRPSPPSRNHSSTSARSVVASPTWPLLHSAERSNIPLSSWCYFARNLFIFLLALRCFPLLTAYFVLVLHSYSHLPSRHYAVVYLANHPLHFLFLILLRLIYSQTQPYMSTRPRS